MENASKALLIAASILIVILLIAMGMRIFDSTAGTTDNLETGMLSTEVATFNGKFTSYAGSGKSAAQVKALANVVIANNATNAQHKVSFNGSYDATTITNDAASRSGTIYQISITYDAKGEYVIGITITP